MTKINVLGSCVARISLLNGELDGHGVYGENMQLGYFLNKQNIVSAMMPPAFSKEECLEKSLGLMPGLFLAFVKILRYYTITDSILHREGYFYNQIIKHKFL